MESRPESKISSHKSLSRFSNTSFLPIINKCPLQDQELPPISEVEHLAAQCVCHRCTCKQHICPSDIRHKHRSALSQFSSKYRIDYHKHNFIPAGKYIRGDNNLHINFPVDFHTTSQRFFVPHNVLPQKSSKLNENNPFQLQFVCRSTYDATFPDWGPLYQNKAKPMPQSYRGNQVQMRCQSSYLQNFTGRQRQDQHRDLAKEIVTRSNNTDGLISPITEWLGNSESRQNFKEFKKHQYPKREPVPKGDYFSLNTWKNQFRSTYQGDYTGDFRPKYEKKKYAYLRKV